MFRRGWTIVELLVSIAVVAILLSLLVPTLLRARDMGFRAVCANNLRQQNMAWQSYIQDNKDKFPASFEGIELHYGGVSYVGTSRIPVLAADRPINGHLADQIHTDVVSELSSLFHCPSDKGVFERDTTKPRLNVLGNASLYDTFGNSYRANRALFDSTYAGIDSLSRPLALHEIQTDTSRLLLTGDAGWFYATRAPGTADASLEASWHLRKDYGNFLAVDGSTRHVDFSNPAREFTLSPRPGLTSAD